MENSVSFVRTATISVPEVK